jgi:putative exporter of polyketide antibiotics
MIRVVLFSLLVVLFPLITYIAYVHFFKHPERTVGEIIADAPVVWLGGLGIVLIVVGLIFYGPTDGASPGKKYHPPEYRDGKIVPGYFE